MLFAGGVSFFGLLAIFPGVAIAVSIYGLITKPEDAAAVVFKVTELMPAQARNAVLDQLRNLTSTPPAKLSLHGIFAFLIALYAAMRGVKALLAGLNRISTSVDVRGILSFNLLAAGLTMAAIFAAFIASVVVISFPVILRSLPIEVDRLHPMLGNVWFWTAAAMCTAVTLLYRFAMAAGRVRWKASLIGAVSATILWTLASGGFAYYVSTLADFGATYGSIGAVVVFLIWIYVAAYSVFFGAALATEAEIEIEERIARAQAEDCDAQAAERAEGAAETHAGAPRKRLWTRLDFLR
jgi:membrane protein